MEKRSYDASLPPGMTVSDQNRLTDLYEGRYAEYGFDVRSVGWGSVEDQHMRFDVLCRGLELGGKSVLDLGCGLGDFVAWAEQKYVAKFKYHGMDLSPSLVDAARERYGSEGRTFSVETLSDANVSKEYDIVILSGALTFKISDNMDAMRALLRNAWRVSREAVCCNFMSSYCDFQLEKNFHYQPEVVFQYAKSISRFVNVYHDYDLYEFTVQLFRNPKLKRGHSK